MNPAPVPFLDLKVQYETLRGEIDEAIAGVLRDAAFIGGPRVKAFEAEFAAYSGVSHAVGVSNGTDALRLALIACGVGPGDDVITVPSTFIATAEAISMVGASVRFADVNPATGCMDPSALERTLTPRTRAVVPVHLYGRPSPMDAILRLARQHGLKVIGDAAQAHGATYAGRPIAAYGDAVCFSFYPGKNLGAYGDAGAVLTNDADVAAKVAMLRDHGRVDKYEHRIEGFNCRMDALQAAVLRVKLRHLGAWTDARRRVAEWYREELDGASGLSLPPPDGMGPDGMERCVYHLFVVQCDAREELARRLAAAGITTGVHYPIPLHLQPAYGRLGLREGSFPCAERLSRRVLSLPMYPELKREQVRRVAEELTKALAQTPALEHGVTA